MVGRGKRKACMNRTTRMKGPACWADFSTRLSTSPDVITGLVLSDGKTVRRRGSGLVPGEERPVDLRLHRGCYAMIDLRFDQSYQELV